MATIQAEQDEIIRSPQAGVLVVQGGPGTGKTVVALHRAAYLLYTYRFPLEDQGVLVVGPNRLFLRYIEQVLPSLGEAGVEVVVLADLVPDVASGAETASRPGSRATPAWPRCSPRRCPTGSGRCRRTWSCPSASRTCGCRRREPERIVQAARRRFRRHNAARRFVEGEVFAALAVTGRDRDDGEDVRDRTRELDAGAGGARAHVAGADAGTSCCTTCSAPAPCCAWPPPSG